MRRLAMMPEIQGLIDFRPEQAADIGAVGVLPTLLEFQAGGGATDRVIFLYHQHVMTTLREVDRQPDANRSAAGDDDL